MLLNTSTQNFDLLGYVCNNSESTLYEVKCCKVAFNTVWGKTLFTLVEGSSLKLLIVILHGGKA